MSVNVRFDRSFLWISAHKYCRRAKKVAETDEYASERLKDDKIIIKWDNENKENKWNKAKKWDKVQLLDEKL